MVSAQLIDFSMSTSVSCGLAKSLVFSHDVSKSV
jgi:hypothetical protein